ncbi:MAG: hypothetical protein H3C47_06560 [Candidatus Cloacimonetes bacterium]|nr:hypothetical protein [Candidatus Cloacimonadota bacterium]
MTYPQLVHYESESEYRDHYRNVYCRKPMVTFDQIEVRFPLDQFEHAFFESKSRNGIKDTFSKNRAQRIDWIKATLLSPHATLFEGWDYKTKMYDGSRRVAIMFECFVVVISLSLSKNSELTGKFITCYQADNSIEKIQRSPKWQKDSCLHKLKSKKKKVPPIC